MKPSQMPPPAGRRVPGKNRGLDADDQGVLIDLNTPEDERQICSMLPVN
jgi:hypothetical protein